MDTQKKFDEYVKDYIKQICESGKFDVNYDEFDVDVTFDVTKHNMKGSYIYLNNEWDLTYKVTIKSKNENFQHSIYSTCHPKYIAAYAVIGYSQSKKEYYEKRDKENIEDNKKTSWFEKIIKRKYG